MAFLFREKEAERKLNIESAAKYDIDKAYFNKIKKGMDYTMPNGEVISNAELTYDPPPPKRYAYCSDTGYFEEIIPQIKNSDVLYHEATFLESEEHYSQTTKHSTAKQAASIAKQAQVGKLILGHFSTRYKDIELFKTEASEVFDQVEIADDGKVFEI